MKDFPITTDLYSEKTASQQPALDLLQSMGYTYISPQDCEAQRGSRYHVLLKDILRGQLRRLNRYTFAGAENEFPLPTLNVPWTIWTNLSQMVWCAPVKDLRCAAFGQKLPRDRGRRENSQLQPAVYRLGAS